MVMYKNVLLLKNKLWIVLEYRHMMFATTLEQFRNSDDGWMDGWVDEYRNYIDGQIER